MPDTRPVNSDCPYCGSTMVVSKMTCGHCQVAVEADFPMSRLSTLPVEHQKFIEMFVLAGGNLKEIAEHGGWFCCVCLAFTGPTDDTAGEVWQRCIRCNNVGTLEFKPPVLTADHEPVRTQSKLP